VLLARGDGPVCLIGADAPLLDAGHVRAVERLLSGGAALVVAPASDGGYSLIGLREPAPALFAGVPWGTPGVMAATRTRAAAAGILITEIEAVDDVDRPEDLAPLADALARAPAAAPRTRHVLASLAAPSAFR
jgi:glycosyltransferase A (GT-A) superfamily protein (DUF2064 family)